jgi:hypothetical protein
MESSAWLFSPAIGYWKLHYCTLFLSYATGSKRAYQIHFAANAILPPQMEFFSEQRVELYIGGHFILLIEPLCLKHCTGIARSNGHTVTRS